MWRRCRHKHHLKKAHRSYPVIGRHKGRADGEFNDLARLWLNTWLPTRRVWVPSRT